MNRTIDRMKPAVKKNTLIFLSFFLWLAVGTMLLMFSYSWLNTAHVQSVFLYVFLGLCASMVIHHFGFLKIVDKNLKRILPMEGKKCFFSFITWKSYITIAVMVTMGILLRHSQIPKVYLSIVYIGIGFSLILSSIRYLRFFFIELKIHK